MLLFMNYQARLTVQQKKQPEGFMQNPSQALFEMLSAF
jgi:hypothetical protein